MKQKIAISAIALLGLFLALGQMNLAAQNSDSEGKQEVRKVKIVKVVNGETTVEERELAPGEDFDWTSEMPEGHEGKVIKQRIEIDGDGDSGEHVIIVNETDGKDGEEHVIVIDGEGEHMHHGAGGDHEMIIIKKKGDGEEDVEIKVIVDDQAY